MKLEADVQRARRGEEAQGLALEDQRGVGEIVDDDQAVGLGEGDDLGEERAAWRSPPSGCSDS